MNNDELLQELSAKISSGELRREDVMRQLKIPAAKKGKAQTDEAHFSVSKVLYVLGAVIVVIGLMFFVSQIWVDIGTIGRIFVTLGLGILMTALGSVLMKKKEQESLGTVFHFIGAMLIPGGAMVTLSELNIDTITPWPTAIAFSIIFAFYLLLNIGHKSAILTFFTIANGTAFVYLVVESIVDGAYYDHDVLLAYLTMVIGLSYLLLAHAFREGWNQPIVGLLYFFGITGFLGAAFTRVFDSVPWQMFYFLLVIGGLFLAVYTRSRAILAMSTIFLIAHVSYITSEYFADSIGWPISLVLLGFIFIGLGYASITINKKYIARG